MNEKAFFEAMLTRAGVVFSEKQSGKIVIEAGDGPNNDGYGGFFGRFHFDSNGKLLKVALFE